jgi:hypothetical protein
MSEQQQVDWNNLRCLYAEDLKGKRITMTIGGVRETPQGARLFCHNEESKAWDVAFAMRDKDGRTPYIQIPCPNAFGKRTSLLRLYVAAVGGDPDNAQAGKAITLYPIRSAKSVSGEAIRIAKAEAQ